MFYLPVGHEPIPFPAVTICPLTPAGLPVLNENYYKYRVFPNTDTDPAVTTPNPKPIVYRGATVTCLQYNNDLTQQEVASSESNALVIRFGQDLSSSSDPFMMTGAVGIVHVPGEDPSFTDPPMFYAPLGQTTQVSILNYYVRNTKRDLTDNYFVAVPALISDNNVGQTNISQIIIAYNQFGYYVQSQFQVYTGWMWVGEVGGAAALLYLLQHAILWMAIGCARRTCFRKQRAARKAAESQEQSDAVEMDTQTSEPAYPVAAIPAAASPSDSPKRRAKKTRSPTDDDDGLSRKPRKPKNNDRVIIDMDSMDESSQ